MSELISILQKKLGLDEKDVVSQLQSYIEFTHARAREPAGMEIQDLGIFVFRGERLIFEPEESLTLAVNYKYRPLSALTIENGEIIALKSDKDSAAEEPVQEPAPMKPEQAQAPEAEDEQTELTQPADPAVRDPETETETESTANEVQEETALSPSKRRIPRAAIAGAVFFVVAVLIIVTLLTSDEIAPPEFVQAEAPPDAEQTTATNENLPADTKRRIAGATDTGRVDDEAGTDRAGAEAPVKAGATDDPPPAPQAEEIIIRSAPTGLSSLPPDERIYAVIVGSTQTEAQAGVHVAQLPDTGYPVTIVPYERNGITGFRVSVGLFRTVSEAESARISLTNSLPDGSWVFRIQ